LLFNALLLRGVDDDQIRLETDNAFQGWIRKIPDLCNRSGISWIRAESGNPDKVILDIECEKDFRHGRGKGYYPVSWCNRLLFAALETEEAYTCKDDHAVYMPPEIGTHCVKQPVTS